MSMSTLSGGLEIWDRRRSGKPQLRSPISWGITGSGALDTAQVREPLQRGLPRFCTTVQSRPLCAEAPIRASAEGARSPGASQSAERWTLHGHCTQQPARLCLKHAPLAMQGLGPPHAQPVASKLPTVQADAEQPYLAMHLSCIHTTLGAVLSLSLDAGRGSRGRYTAWRCTPRGRTCA